jgi:hypothetical protein
MHHHHRYSFFSWEEKLVAPLIATPNGEVRKWEDKGTVHRGFDYRLRV